MKRQDYYTLSIILLTGLVFIPGGISSLYESYLEGRIIKHSVDYDSSVMIGNDSCFTSIWDDTINFTCNGNILGSLTFTSFLKRFQIVVTGFKAAGSIPATETTYGLDGAWSFSATQTNSIANAQAVFFDIDKTKPMNYTIGWASPTNTGQVVWLLEVIYRQIGEDWSSTTPDVSIYKVVNASANANGLVLTSFALPLLNESDAGMIFRFNRIGGNDSDTLNDVAYVFGGAIDYYANKLGI
jgi:hypothetical protein